jgi:putative addiction module component (TIGR02574 family)
LLEQAGLGDEIELNVLGNQLLITPAGYKPRQGWEEAFRAMAEAGDDPMLDEDLGIAERILQVEDLWNSIVASPESVEITQAQRDELDRRLAARRDSGVPDIPWDAVKTRLRARK